MPRVAVFAKKFGVASETFVHDELRHHTRYEIDVLCTRRQNADRFPFHPVHVDGSRSFGWRRRSAAFERLCSARDYELVHAHFGTGAVLVAPLARRAGLPLVVTFHGYEVPLMQSRERPLGKRWRYTRWAPAMLRQMTLGLCASTELLEILHEFGVPRERLRVHRLGVDLARFRVDTTGQGARDPEWRVAMVGRLVPKKGFAYALRALAIAAEKVPLRAVVAGTGPLENELRSLVESLGMADRVCFVGDLDSDAVADLLRESDVLLCPSVVARDGNRESGLLVAKEASACETVPVGTMHGGIPEIIEDGVSGFLVPERDVETLAERLLRVLGDAGLRERLGRAARRKMELEYDIRERNRALEATYDEVISSWGKEGRDARD